MRKITKLLPVEAHGKNEWGCLEKTGTFSGGLLPRPRSLIVVLLLDSSQHGANVPESSHRDDHGNPEKRQQGHDQQDAPETGPAFHGTHSSPGKGAAGLALLSGNRREPTTISTSASAVVPSPISGVTSRPTWALVR